MSVGRGAADGGSYAPTMAIVSAKGGVTDKLIKVVNAAMEDIEDAKSLLRTVADEQIEVVRRGSVRRAKLYYLRERRGKSARIAERTTARRTETAASVETMPAEPLDSGKS